MICKLCDSSGCTEFARDKHRVYIRCSACGLVFVPPEYWLTEAQEKQRYSLHHNTFDNQDYVGYLRRMVKLVAREAKPEAMRILDFGSGEHAILTRLLSEMGLKTTPYDPLYGIGDGALDSTYDFIVMNEVIEHLRDLKGEVHRIAGALTGSGTLLIRTRLYPAADFPKWWYSHDSTHINFFAVETITRLAQTIKARVDPGSEPDTFLLRRDSPLYA